MAQLQVSFWDSKTLSLRIYDWWSTQLPKQQAEDWLQQKWLYMLLLLLILHLQFQSSGSKNEPYKKTR